MHEARAVHRLDRRPDWRAVTVEPFAQSTQPVGIRRRGTNVDRHAFIVEQVEVETLAT
jgi:hypothetical protein